MGNYGKCYKCGFTGYIAHHKCLDRFEADENTCVFFTGLENRECERDVYYDNWLGMCGVYGPPCQGRRPGLKCHDAEYKTDFIQSERTIEMNDTKASKELTVINDYMATPAVLGDLAEILGEPGAKAYAQSVMIVVAGDERLQLCEPKTIFISALRCATLRLSVDPAARQAYLVNYGGKCTLQVSYKGLYDLALRTGKYRWINIYHVNEGEEWVRNPLSGIHDLQGAKVSDNIIGWFAAFQFHDGFTKTLYMSKQEIHDHAKRYNPKGYAASKGVWKTNPQAMERKTPLKIILNQWGYIAPNDQAVLLAAATDAGEEIMPAEDLPLIEAEAKADKPKPKKKTEGKKKPTPPPPASKPWDKRHIERLLSVTDLISDEAAIELLDKSGMSKSAAVGAIGKWAGCYQTQITAKKTIDQAIAHAKKYWQDFGPGSKKE